MPIAPDLLSTPSTDLHGAFEIIVHRNGLENPEVSVIMPVYNGISYLRPAVESILDQKFSRLEFIVIDDGSSDGGGEMLLDYLRKDARIVLVRQQNMGLTKSLNRGIRLAKAPFIARQDADDISHPDRLGAMLGFARASRASIFGCDYEIMDGFSLIRRHLSDRKHLKYRMLISNQFAHGSLLARREFLVRLGAYDESLPCSQDYDLLTRALAMEKGSVVAIPGYFYKLRLHDSSVSVRKKKLQSKIAWKIRREYLFRIFFG